MIEICKNNWIFDSRVKDYNYDCYKDKKKEKKKQKQKSERQAMYGLMFSSFRLMQKLLDTCFCAFKHAIMRFP